MGNKLDGFSVDIYDGRFSGTFEMDEEIGQDINYEDVISFVVVAAVGKANFNTQKNGEVKRTNVFAVENVKILKPEVASQLIGSQDS